MFQALYENMLIELPFASFFLSKMLGQHTLNVDIDHLQSLDPELYKNLLYLKVPNFSYLFIRNSVSFFYCVFWNLLSSSVSINQSLDFEHIESFRFILKYDLSIKTTLCLRRTKLENLWECEMIFMIAWCWSCTQFYIFSYYFNFSKIIHFSPLSDPIVFNQ